MRMIEKVSTVLAVIAAILAVPAFGMSDFYTMEMGVKSPAYVSYMIFICFLLIMPKSLFVLYDFVDEFRHYMKKEDCEDGQE